MPWKTGELPLIVFINLETIRSRGDYLPLIVGIGDLGIKVYGYYMADVARGHGGDAGGDPPQGPWRPSSHCEGSAGKKVRGKSTNQALRKELSRNGNKRFPVTFEVDDQDTLSPVGRNSSRFIRMVGNLVGEITKYYYTWKDVPDEHKINIFPELEYYFDLTSQYQEEGGGCPIKKGIDRLCADRYRDCKYRLKTGVFEKVGGFENPKAARENTPCDMTTADWSKCVDYFIDPKNMTNAEKNKLNRSQHRYPSLYRSSSYAAARHKKLVQEGLYPPLIGTFHDIHSKSGEFVNSLAQQDYETMQRLRNEQMQSSSSVNGQEILTQVLGERRGHNLRRGRKLKGVASRSTCTQPPNEEMLTKSQVPSMFESYNQQLFQALRNANDPVLEFHPVLFDNNANVNVRLCSFVIS